jgi:hypothetical protein
MTVSISIDAQSFKKCEATHTGRWQNGCYPFFGVLSLFCNHRYWTARECAHQTAAFTARGETQAANLIGALVGCYLSRTKDRLYIGKVVSIRTVTAHRLRMLYTAYLVEYQQQYDEDIGKGGDGFDSEELNGKESTAARKLYAQHQKENAC